VSIDNDNHVRTDNDKYSANDFIMHKRHGYDYRLCCCLAVAAAADRGGFAVPESMRWSLSTRFYFTSYAVTCEYYNYQSIIISGDNGFHERNGVSLKVFCSPYFSFVLRAASSGVDDVDDAGAHSANHWPLLMV
jgi:hypothetical protein